MIKSKAIWLACIVVIVLVVGSHARFELPISNVVRDGDRLKVYYWAKKAPMVDVTANCDFNSQRCEIGAKQSYGLIYWFNPSIEGTIILPKGTEDFKLVLRTQDKTGDQ